MIPLLLGTDLQICDFVEFCLIQSTITVIAPYPFGARNRDHLIMFVHVQRDQNQDI